MNAYRTGGYGFQRRETTSAVKTLIIANAAVFGLQTVFGGGLLPGFGFLERWFTFVPGIAIFGLQIWRFVSYMFLHGGLFHIAMNMFILWMFGSQIEALWGKRTFLTYYFTCGVGAAVIYGLFNLFGLSAYVPMLGASGAVYGILLAYGLTFPDNIILVFFILPLKAKYAVVLFGLIEFMSIPSGGSVAHLAHLGGMLAGYIFLQATAPGLARRGRGGGNDLAAAWRRFRTRSRMRVVRPGDRPDGGNGDGRDDVSPEDQRRIDGILDKISREGLKSLTDEEQEILRRAGRR